jgi:hypothetical protein
MCVLETLFLDSIMLLGRCLVTSRSHDLQRIPIHFAYNDFPARPSVLRFQFLFQPVSQDVSKVGSLRVGMVAYDDGLSLLRQREGFVLHRRKRGKQKPQDCKGRTHVAHLSGKVAVGV